ncbi:type 4 prepilin peptidase 1 [Paenibacillus marchantiophytorum]|uniref:Type 4 prepilin peptidase 1 n=1 Tax=Paenibacillus marchantiophytorum TaxID=1619310 RepID=A0ABQ1EVP8_9BACL|nr:prepilin peptidase [Paenibacillus marchantiophytorum]GFZ88092.1 type 4 prepilin peptidase 1 [Paenibacillus marchantiophytorum]
MEETIIHLLFFIVIAIALISDVRCAIIPNKLTIGGTIIGLGFHAATAGWSGFVFALIGAGIGFMMLFILYMLGALGAGDVKLFTAIGAIMGGMFVLQLTVFAILCAGAIGLGLLCIQKRMLATGNKLAGWLFTIIVCQELDSLFSLKRQSNTKFPFMYAVAPSTVFTWYYSFL